MNDYLMYLRKSRQDDERETIEEVLARHERQLQEYAVKSFGFHIVENNIYREVVSGETIDDRPMINEVFKRIQKDNIKGVLVIEPSRLTRGDLLDCGTVVHIFRYTTTLVITPSKTYNLDDKYDRKFFEMELTRGNDYLEYTKEILERGRNASAREGNYLGSIAPYGYDKVKIGKTCTLAINEKEAEFVRLAFHLYVNEGLGTNSIAHRLNSLGAKPRKSERFDSVGIKQILENVVYLGKIKLKAKPQVKIYEDGKLVKKRIRSNEYEVVEGKHPAIISEELFQKAKNHKGRVSRETPDLALKNIYAGLLKCKKCGKAIAMRIHRKNGEVIANDRYYCKSGIYCTCKSSVAKVVQKAIRNSLVEFLNDFEVKMQNDNSGIIKTHETILKQQEKQLELLEVKQNDLYDLLESGIYTKEVFIKRNEKLAVERERLTEAIKKARETVPEVIDYKEKYATLHKLIETLDDDLISAKEKNNFLKEVIKVIYYEKDEIAPRNQDDADNINLEIILK